MMGGVVALPLADHDDDSWPKDDCGESIRGEVTPLAALL